MIGQALGCALTIVVIFPGHRMVDCLMADKLPPEAGLHMVRSTLGNQDWVFAKRRFQISAYIRYAVFATIGYTVLGEKSPKCS